MKTTEEQLRTVKKLKSLGLVANGSAGSWQVAVDETLTGDQQWFAQIEGPSCYLNFEIGHARAMAEMLDFLNTHLHRNGDQSGSTGLPGGSPELKLGPRGGHAVDLLWDRDTVDRCFILIRGDDDLCVRVALARSDLEALAAALRQVREALSEDGLLDDSA